MKLRILSALVAMGVAGSALAQGVPPPPMNGQPHPQLNMRVPPLPPGCLGGNREAPPPSALATSGGDEGLTKTVGLTGSEATKVQQVFAHQAAQAQQIDQQRRAMDEETCRRLQAIVGDKAMTRWAAAMPPPPGGPGRGPGRDPDPDPDPDRGPGAPPPPPDK